MADGHDDPAPSAGASDPLIEKVIGWIVRKELQAPATFVLEMHRPLMPLAWPAAMLLSGFVAPLVGPDYVERIEALRDPAFLDRLLKRLQADRSEG